MLKNLRVLFDSPAANVRADPSGGAEGGRAGAKRSEIFFEIGSNLSIIEFFF